MPTDSDEKRSLAARQRDSGLLNPGDPDYDNKMSEMWGGPPPKWFDMFVNTNTAMHSTEAKNKVALVTGSTGGIGFYVAKCLAAIGYTVIIPKRRREDEDAIGTLKAIKRDAPQASLIMPDVPLDLRSFSSTKAFSDCVKQHVGSIDVLALNAGRGGGVRDPRDQTGDDCEAILQVNVLSHALLTEQLMPLLRASPASRVVSQTSGARFGAKQIKVHDINGKDASQFSAFDQYQLSKAANVLFTKCLNERLVANGITNVVACVSDPGLTSTGVNIQHDLTLSMGQTAFNTNQMHDRVGHHAADGALPMCLACIDTSMRHNDWYTTDGVRARFLSGAAHKQDPNIARTSMSGAPMARTDPLLEDVWPRPLRESFWAQCNTASGATWPDFAQTFDFSRLSDVLPDLDEACKL